MSFQNNGESIRFQLPGLTSDAYFIWQGFKFDRTLGWGGEGIACLFSYTNRNGQNRQRVAKIGFRGTAWRNETKMSMVSQIISPTKS